MRFWINTQKTDFRRILAQIGNNLVPFQIGQIFENRTVACSDVGSVVCAPMLVNARSASTGRTERENLVFMIGSIDPTFRFHNKSYATVAGIGDAGGSCLGVQRIDELDNESV